ncbi:hypothetical protein CFK39_04835 [Brachybacterium avium]|uniref:Uncharacterized protein n=1 Tax=Brachybacterium avium TaxID=2017485 RepID=A0A220UAY5_9MICO|nr:hypothetical protein [Brachybacterium avium]ASK65267.1 hypothetical protein CFK39_04835 [Brachybacterium avium]
MSETNHPYGDRWSQSRPGSGYPGHEAGPYGYNEVPPTAPPSGGSAGSVPSAPEYGVAHDSAAPPSSADSAAPGPWAASASSASAAPSGSPGAQALSASQVGAALRRFGIGNPLPTFVIGALAYVVALGAALVVIVSAVLAILTLGTGGAAGGVTDPIGGSSSPSGAGGWRGIVGLVGIPFQLVSLASFGSYGLELNLGFLGSASMSFRGMPLLITAAMVATAFFAARGVQRRWGTGRWGSNGVLGALLWSGISGLSVAIFAVIATRVTAFVVKDDSTGFDGMSISMHSAGADMFFGTWVLIALPLFLGHVAGIAKPAWWPLVADLAAAPRLVLVHALAFAVPVGALLMVGGAITMLVEGEGRSVLSLLLALPIWGLSGLALLPGLGMLAVPVHLNLRGGVEEFGMERTNEFLWFFDLPWYAWIPLVLIALLMPVVVSLLWHRDREIETGNILALVASWVALPFAYFGGSIVLLALVWTSMNAQLGMMGNVVVNVGLAPWIPLVAFFIGVLVEVLARFGAPFADQFVPGVLVNWFRRSARARRAAVPENMTGEPTP